MFFSPAASVLVSVASLPVLAAANNVWAHHLQRDPHDPRQASPPPASSSPGSVGLPPTGTGVVPPPHSSTVGASGIVPPATGSATLPPAAPTTTYTFSLLSTNPTAVPLSSIISTAPSSVTRPLDHTFAPGSQPTFLPGAPPLPNGQ